MVFSFIGRRTQPLQLRKHLAFRYEGTQDPTRMSPEPMAQSEVIKRCCKVLNNFDKSLMLPTLFSAQNPPENAWVRALDTMSTSFCRRIINPGIVCLRLLQMLIMTTARNGRWLPDQCYIGKFLVSMPASKYIIFC